MCGIAGLWSNFCENIHLEEDIKNMASNLNHRGPDNEGFWSEPKLNFYLSHKRLSILDISTAGSQPMISHNERYVISFNGEIYNNFDLRNELEKINNSIKWRGHSDTEILLELISYFGIEKALIKCTGMFALALWDRNEKCLKLARDRMGEKPLYYGFSGGDGFKTFLFGSELSAIKSWRFFDNNINPNALFQLLNYQAISAPSTIFKGIHQLLPGHIFTLKNLKSNNLPESKPWWDLKSSIEKSLADPIIDSECAISATESILKESIKLQIKFY